MSRITDYQEELEALLEDTAARGESLERLERFLVAESRLPGPRANLELAHAFGDTFEGRPERATDGLRRKLVEWATLSAEAAPTGDPREFLPFCALQAIAALFPDFAHPQADSGGRDDRYVPELLRKAANDPRWRMREAVAMAFQRIGRRDFEALADTFTAWLTGGASFYEQRAIVASLAEPNLLSGDQRAAFSLRIAGEIMERVPGVDAGDRRSEEFRVLRKGLDYALSVLVEKAPTLGFPFLDELARNPDREVRAIVKANLRHKRLQKFPAEVSAVAAALGEAGEAPA